MNFEALVQHMIRVTNIPIYLNRSSYELESYGSCLSYHAYYASGVGVYGYSGSEKIMINMDSPLVGKNPFRVLLHELAHATGKSSIFNRSAVSNPMSGYCAGVRENEEIIADTAAIIILRELGLSDSVTELDHEHYISAHTRHLLGYGMTPDMWYLMATAEQAAKYIRENWLVGFNG